MQEPLMYPRLPSFGSMYGFGVDDRERAATDHADAERLTQLAKTVLNPFTEEDPN